MKRCWLAALCVVVWCASVSVEARVRFPKAEDLRGISTACGGGETEQVHRVAEVVKELKSDPSSRESIESARRNLAAVIEKVTPTSGGNELYKKYVGCMQDLIDKFLVVNNLPRTPVNPGSEVDGFLSIGATYGAIKTGTGESATNDNQPIGLARVGLWFNEHVAVGLEGSYWQRKTQLMEVGQPTRTVASTATVPLYLHFGRRFPFMMYAGIGRGWESNEYLVLDSSGTKQRMTKGDSGLAWVAGAGFEYAWTQHVSVTVLARAIRTRIDSAPHVGEKRERDVLSFGVVLSRH